MLKKTGLVLIAATIIFFGGYKILQIKRLHTTDALQPAWPQQIIAVYDTGKNVIMSTNDSVLYYTLSWVNDLEQSLPKVSLQSLVEKKQPLFINLQIWHKELISKFDEEVATIILKGSYDKKLISLFSLFANSTKTVYLRFNAEMEVPVTKYPWQYQPCMQYIRSFRHIILLCKKYSPNVKLVWGPAGYPGTEEYYPGDEYVDFASINMNLVPELIKDPFPAYTSATDMMRRKLFRLRFINKPILFLATASFSKTTLQQKWIDELNKKLDTEKSIYRTPVTPLDTDTIGTVKSRNTNLKIGVYDPLLLLADQPLVTVEHLFPNIGTVKDGTFKKEFDGVILRHHDVIVTMEAWRNRNREKDTAILSNTLMGKYDSVWAMLYKIIADVPQTVYLRWGHEMEIPVDRYPWQKQDPETYIKAFRYFAGFQKPRASNVKIVWGPTGDRGCMEWWPGKDVVDFVSIAIYGLPDKNINDYNRQQSFTTIFQNKYHRIRFTHKPIFITEFGVKGPEAYQKKWLEEAAATINKYSEIIGVSYFNAADSPKAWGDVEIPDWSITAATLKSFAGLLKNVQNY